MRKEKGQEKNLIQIFFKGMHVVVVVLMCCNHFWHRLFSNYMLHFYSCHYTTIYLLFFICDFCLHMFLSCRGVDIIFCLWVLEWRPGYGYKIFGSAMHSNESSNTTNWSSIITKRKNFQFDVCRFAKTRITLVGVGVMVRYVFGYIEEANRMIEGFFSRRLKPKQISITADVDKIEILFFLYSVVHIKTEKEISCCSYFSWFVRASFLKYYYGHTLDNVVFIVWYLIIQKIIPRNWIRSNGEYIHTYDHDHAIGSVIINHVCLLVCHYFCFLWQNVLCYDDLIVRVVRKRVE